MNGNVIRAMAMYFTIAFGAASGTFLADAATYGFKAAAGRDTSAVVVGVVLYLVGRSPWKFWVAGLPAILGFLVERAIVLSIFH